MSKVVFVFFHVPGSVYVAWGFFRVSSEGLISVWVTICGTLLSSA